MTCHTFVFVQNHYLSIPQYPIYIALIPFTVNILEATGCQNKHGN